MGFLRKVGATFGQPDKELLKSGLLVPGLVVKCEPTGMGVGSDNSTYGVQQVCLVTVQIHGVPGREPYEASCKHAIPRPYLPQMQQQGATVAVRVDPNDPQHIELDLTAEPPPIPGAGQEAEIPMPTGPDGKPLPMTRSQYTAAEILREGVPCKVEITAAVSLPTKDSEGRPAVGFQLQIHTDDGQRNEVQIGLGVPPAAMPLVAEGAFLPGKVIAGNPQFATIDWDAAMAEAGIQAQ